MKVSKELTEGELFARERRHFANHFALGIGSGKYCRTCADIRYTLHRRADASPMFVEAAR